MNYSIDINMDQRCAECGKPGATGSGICLKCATKVLSAKPLKSAKAKAIREQLRASHERRTPFALAAEVTNG